MQNKDIKKVNFSIIRYKNSKSQEVINIGIILNTPEQTMIHLPINTYTVHKFALGEDSADVVSFIQSFIDKKEISSLPDSIEIIEIVHTSRYKFINNEVLFSELIREYISTEALREREVILEVNKEEIELEIKIDASLDSHMEREVDGFIPYSTIIKQYFYDDEKNIEKMEEIGRVNFMKIEDGFDILDTLDVSEKTEDFMHLFNYSSELEEEYLNIINKRYPYFSGDISEVVIMTSAIIDEKYRNNRLLKSAYSRINRIMNNEQSLQSLLLFKAFSEKSNDLESLKKYYEELGFLNLGKYNNGYIMCHPLAYNLIGKK